MSASARPAIGAITLDIMRSSLMSIGDEMAVALQRAAYSTNIKTRLDFSCAFFDGEFRLITQAFGPPAHLGALPHSVPRALREYGVHLLGPGDAVVYNDPHRGSTHLNDVALVAPWFHRGRLLGYVANIAHHVDVGGGSPGSLGVSTEVFQEGLIIPPARLVIGGEINPDVMRFIMSNTRLPVESAGDFRAQIAANNLAIRRLDALVDSLGPDLFETYCDDLLHYAERRTRAGFARLPRGTFKAEDWLDDDGVSDEPVRVAVSISIGEEIVVDLAGSAVQRAAPVNATFSMAYSAVAYALRTQLDADVPINDGFYRCFRVLAPEGTVVNPTPPAPVAAGWEVSFRVAEAMFRALALAVPDRVVAGTKGCICNVAFGGTHPATGRYYAHYETQAGGGGARPTKDGLDGIQTHIHNTENAPVEEVELSYAVRILQTSLIPDSEGAGRHRGGLGVRRDYWFPAQRARFSLLSDRKRFPPWGLDGGLPARGARYVRNPDHEPEDLPSKVTLSTEPGEIISIQTPGGGGYGPPHERDPEAVLRDVLLGKVSEDRARSVYAVVIDARSRSVDPDATARLRSELDGGNRVLP